MEMGRWGPKHTARHAAKLVSMMFKVILERDPRDDEMIIYGSWLVRGEMRVSNAKLNLFNSEEFEDRFVEPFNADQATDSIFSHVMLSSPDAQQLNKYRELYMEYGYRTVVRHLMAHESYNRKFGPDGVMQNPQHDGQEF